MLLLSSLLAQAASAIGSSKIATRCAVFPKTRSAGQLSPTQVSAITPPARSRQPDCARPGRQLFDSGLGFDVSLGFSPDFVSSIFRSPKSDFSWLVSR